MRTYARALDTMVESAALEINKADGARICIIHSNAAGEAGSLATKLREKMTTVPAVFEQLEAGPVIGTHAGQGAVGLFVIPGI